MKREVPKNVRQIGNVSDSSKIYVEDYVDTFFNQLCEKSDQKTVGAFLVGEIVREKEEDYIYVYGAVRMQELLQKGKDIFISEETWKKACEDCKQYFGNAEILGWFLAAEGQALETNHNILKVHQKFFAREKSIFVVKEAREKEEKYFVHKFKDLMEVGGHYIYYEKNVEMQDYMITNRKKNGMTPSEIIEDTVTKNFRNVIQGKIEKKEKKSSSRYVYALSTFLVLVLVVTGITMMNNYDKLQTMKDSLSKIEKPEDALETLNSLTDKEDEETEEETPVEDTPEAPEVPQEPVSPEVPQETPQETPQENPQEPTEAEGSEAVEPSAYTVQKGDTLASISIAKYGNTGRVDEICELNGLEDVDLIFIGQKLLLP
ncbi:MAG: LysM peptidoglycan-binding domain-containing protein [Faecalimonas sp.]|nr:LysM peptidoglycan-binding domain-containing protein [Faecalimonas sp.]